MNMAAPSVLATSMGAMMFSMRWTASSNGRATSKMMPICISSAMRATDPLPRAEQQVEPVAGDEVAVHQAAEQPLGDGGEGAGEGGKAPSE
jgi:hypothetical protein